MRISLILTTVVPFLIFTATDIARAADPQAVGRIIDTESGSITIHPVEHGSMVLQYGTITVYVDPVGGAGKYSKYARPDYILITDYHGDHFDLDTVKGLLSSKTRIVAPRTVLKDRSPSQRGSKASKVWKEDRKVKGLKDKMEILRNDSSAFFGRIDIKAIPMYNLAPDRARFHTKGRGNGYVINFDGMRVYISGDTEDIPEMRQLENIDVAFVCMNSPYTMEVEQAASAVLEFKPRNVLPFHYRNRDGTYSDLQKFKELVAEDPEIVVHLLDWYP